MHLKSNINFADFLNACSKCKGEVLFTTPEGDVLNLKSELSRYVFAALTPDEEFIQHGSIVNQNPDDLDAIRDYLTED